jgi:hypothetical protein
MAADITEGNRQNLTDARDPGGRLGPYIEANPDLRNLHLYYRIVEPEDIILIISGMCFPFTYFALFLTLP